MTLEVSSSASMPRYELWSESLLKFWEFELKGTTVIDRRGDRLTRGQPEKSQSTTRRYASPDEARLAYEDLIAAKLDTGKWRPPPLSDSALLRNHKKKARDPGIRRLEEAARKSRRLKIQFALALPEALVTPTFDDAVRKLRRIKILFARDLPKGLVTATFDIRGFGAKYRPPVRIEFATPGRTLASAPPDLEAAFSETQHRYPRGKILLGNMTIKTWSCPLTPSALAELMTSILAERFETVEVPVEPKLPRAVVGEAAPESSPAPARRPNDWPETDIRLDLQVQRMHFTPDGRYLVMLLGPEQLHSASYAVEIWERGATKPLRVMKFPRTPFGVECLAVSPDGKYFVAGYQALRVHEIPSGRLVGYLEGHRDRNWNSVHDVVFSPDGSRVASASYDKTSRLWDFRSRKPLACFQHKAYVRSVVFAPGGQRLITGCMFQQASAPFSDLQGFDLEGARLVQYRPPKGETAFWTESLVISPDGRLLVAGCAGGTRSTTGAGVWDLKSGRSLRVLSGGRNFCVTEAVFIRGGAFLLTAHYKDLRIWKAKTWKCVAVLEGDGRMALTADERFIATEDRKQKQVRVRRFVGP